MLGYYFGMDWETYYNFPVAYKKWLIKRIEKEVQRAHGKGDIPSKGMHQNTPDARALTGRSRPIAPAKLQRFT